MSIRPFYVKWLSISALLLLLFSCIGCFILWPNTNVFGVDVGLKTVREAESALASALSWDDVKITFCADGRQIRVRFKELGISPCFYSSAAACKRPLWKCGQKDYPLILTVQEDVFLKYMAGLDKRFKKEPVDAKFQVSEKDIILCDEEDGRVLDRAEFRELFPLKIYSLIEAADLPFIAIKPKVTKEDLEPYLPLGLKAQYSTAFQDGTDRAHNVRLASQSFQEFVVWPGCVFSFNGITGPRTSERGYKKAPVIAQGKLVDDYGGGVCQVSTTIYVAALKANLSVVERHNHGLPVSYVPLGLDATVSYDYLDLKMKNPYDSPCIIHCEADEGILTVKVFGKTTDEKVDIESRVLEEYPPYGDYEDGEQKPLRKGYLVETVRRILKGDGQETKERLNTSMYPPEKPASR